MYVESINLLMAMAKPLNPDLERKPLTSDPLPNPGERNASVQYAPLQEDSKG